MTRATTGLRVIAGSLRGRRIRTPRGLEVRPTSDRLREALFSSLASRVVGARVWDACAGTGALGIEALSRGAASVVFSEPAPPAAQLIRANLEELGLGDRGELLGTSWERALDRFIAAGREFDLVLFDPPWGLDSYVEFLAGVVRVLGTEGRVAIEHPTRRGQALAPPGLAYDRALAAGRATVTLFVRLGPPG